MRFDDSLKTVLAADTSSAFGAQSAFRQIVDLMGRGRIPADGETTARLRALRSQVPESIRAASARALALASPPAGLVELFGEDEPAVAGPVLRIADLSDDEWSMILPRIGPTGRSVLRARDDLTPAVVRALETFGATDFTIGYEMPAGGAADQPTAPPIGAGPFVALGTVARELPIVAEALRRSEARVAKPSPQRFEIAELVDRIESFQRDRETEMVLPEPLAPPPGFRFETDADGVVRWVEGVARGALVGLSFAAGGVGAQVDGVAVGAFRQRTGFRDARLTVGGTSEAAGSWRISGAPMFDRQTGRFLGMRGLARRPRDDERPREMRGNRAGAEALRRLVHELRTPTNAISGFAELIETEMLGPVAPVHRERATAIRTHTADLVAAIDDLDMAARIESGALELRPGVMALAPMIKEARDGLGQLAALRGCAVDIAGSENDLEITGDDRAVARLIERLLAVLVSASAKGERVTVSTCGVEQSAEIAFSRPAALAHVPDDVLLSIDAEQDVDEPGVPLLGTGFALRLALKLARELDGELTISAERLTLRLPAALTRGVQVSTS